MFILVVDRRLLVTLVDWVEVGVCSWIEQEIGACPSCRVRRVIVVNVV